MQGFLLGAASAGASTKRYASDFGDLMASPNARARAGNNIRQSFNMPGGSPLRPFETPPNWHTEGTNSFAPPLQATEDVNPRITVQGRRTMAFGKKYVGMTDLKAPSERELCFVWRLRSSGDKSDLLNIRTGPNFMNSLYGAPQMQTELPGNPVVQVQSMPSLAADPCVLNYVIADLQRNWCEKDQDAYLHLPDELLVYGGRQSLEGIYPRFLIDKFNKLPGFAEYEGFDLDGIPRNVVADDGTAPQYGNDVTLGMRDRRVNKVYSVAMTARGAEMCLDYWDAHGLEAGTLLYMVLKKSPIERYTHRARSSLDDRDHLRYLLYNLATKANDEFRDGAGMRRELQMPTLKINGEEKFMTPFQWHFVSSKTTLDREHAKYEDELGITRYGFVLYVGTVLHPPPSGMKKSPTPLGQSRPYMNNRHAMQCEPFEIILNPQDFRCAA